MLCLSGGYVKVYFNALRKWGISLTFSEFSVSRMVNISTKGAMSRKVQHKYGLVTNPERGNRKQAAFRNKKINMKI